jgi:hypothetical protein
VGDEETAIEGTLESTENTGTSGGGGKTNIKAHAEGAGLVFNLLNLEVLAVDVLLNMWARRLVSFTYAASRRSE